MVTKCYRFHKATGSYKLKVSKITDTLPGEQIHLSKWLHLPFDQAVSLTDILEPRHCQNIPECHWSTLSLITFHKVLQTVNNFSCKYPVNIFNTQAVTELWVNSSMTGKSVQLQLSTLIDFLWQLPWTLSTPSLSIPSYLWYINSV